MLHTLLCRGRDERGQSQVALLGAIAVVIVSLLMVAIGSSVSAVGAIRSTPATQAADARALLARAQHAAVQIAFHDGGSFSAVGRVNLRKQALIPTGRVVDGPWLSASWSAPHAYSLTVTAEPSGERFTLVRSAAGTITRSWQLG